MGVAGVAAGAAIAGTAVSGYGAYEQGQAASHTAAYQAEVANNNQKIANQNADYAARAGEAKATAQSLKGANTAGMVRTAIAANNVDINSGSPTNVEASQREESNLDTATTLNNSLLQAYGYRTQAANFGAQSALDTTESSQANIAGDIGAGGSLLSGAGSVGFKWAGTQTPGSFNYPTNITNAYDNVDQ